MPIIGKVGNLHKRGLLPYTCAAILWLSSMFYCAADAAQESLVLVERMVDTRYGETTHANADFDSALQSPLVIARTIEKDESLQSITSKVYGIGPKADAKRYAALEARIKDLNKLVDANKLVAGAELLLPDIPPKQYKLGSGNNPYYGQPRISAGPRRTDVLSGKGFNFDLGATKFLGAISDLKRKAAPLVRQLRWVSASIVKNDPSIRVLSQPITIDFSASQGNQFAQEIAQDVQNVRGYASANAGVHESVVFVLDDSWPDNAEFQTSLEFFKRADTIIRQTYHLGDAKWPSTLAATSVSTSFPFDTDSRRSHARLIKTSLEPFTTLNSKVRVVYLPLFVEQKWAPEVLREIILVTMIARGKDADLANNLSVDTMTDIVQQAEKTTDDIMKQLPEVTTGQLVATDQAIIAALLKFCQLYAQATGAPFFLNTSWTVKRYEIEFGPDPDLFGVVMAAAGNSTDADVYKNPVLLASRAREYPGDVIVVGNAHPNGDRDGCSAFWTPPDGVPFYGLMYNGFLSAQDCGSSFSTPRIAWILAFRESMRPLVSDDTTKQGWFAEYRKFILGLQNAKATRELRYWFSPQAALQGLKK